MTEKFTVTALETVEAYGVKKGNKYLVQKSPFFKDTSWVLCLSGREVCKRFFSEPLKYTGQEAQEVPPVTFRVPTHMLSSIQNDQPLNVKGQEAPKFPVQTISMGTEHFLIEQTGAELRLETIGADAIDFPKETLSELLTLLNHAKEHML